MEAVPLTRHFSTVPTAAACTRAHAAIHSLGLIQYAVIDKLGSDELMRLTAQQGRVLRVLQLSEDAASVTSSPAALLRAKAA
jgi:hypothetical protein